MKNRTYSGVIFIFPLRFPKIGHIIGGSGRSTDRQRKFQFFTKNNKRLSIFDKILISNEYFMYVQKESMMVLETLENNSKRLTLNLAWWNFIKASRQIFSRYTSSRWIFLGIVKKSCKIVHLKIATFICSITLFPAKHWKIMFLLSLWWCNLFLFSKDLKGMLVLIYEWKYISNKFSTDAPKWTLISDAYL